MTDSTARGLAVKGLNGVANIQVVLQDIPEFFDYGTANFTYNGNTQLSQIVWRDVSNNILRTDTFTYSSDSTTNTTVETRTPAVGGVVVITSVFDLDGNIISITKS